MSQMPQWSSETVIDDKKCLAAYHNTEVTKMRFQCIARSPCFLVPIAAFSFTVGGVTAEAKEPERRGFVTRDYE